MKSKTLAIQNIPENPPVIRTIHVKPTTQLIFLIFTGVGISVLTPQYFSMGVMAAVIGSFCLVALPDRKMLEFTHDYAILYNQQNRNACLILYWDEIVSWTYHRRSDKDELEFVLIDDRVEKVECYSKKSVLSWLELYAPKKEKVSRRGRRGKK